MASLLLISLGTAVNPQRPNATTDESDMMSVIGVIYNTIFLNIGDTLVNLITKIEVRIESTTPTKPPINFTAPIMISSSLGKQLIVTIPQENTAAIEKGLAYFVKVSDHAISGPCVPILIQYIIYNRLDQFL